MKVGLLHWVRRVSLEKDGVLACWPAASNSRQSRCVNFFSCETRLHPTVRKFEVSL